MPSRKMFGQGFRQHIQMKNTPEQSARHHNQ